MRDSSSSKWELQEHGKHCEVRIFRTYTLQEILLGCEVKEDEVGD
jgi:hypothetical protein